MENIENFEDSNIVRKKLWKVFEDHHKGTSFLQEMDQENGEKINNNLYCDFQILNDILENIWLSRKVSLKMIKSMTFEKQFILAAILKNRFKLTVENVEEKELKQLIQKIPRVNRLKEVQKTFILT